MLKYLEMPLSIPELISATKDIFIVVGGLIALISYRSQNRQRGIDNSFNSIKMFEKSIQEKDIQMWRDIYFNSYEGVGAIPGNFVVFTENEAVDQIPISSLFIPEGQGLYVTDSRMSLDKEITNLELGSVRLIAEHLNLIGYEFLYGNIELRIIYYELGQLIESIYIWITEIEDEETRKSTESMFPYFIKMCKKCHRKMESFPRKNLITLD